MIHVSVVHAVHLQAQSLPQQLNDLHCTVSPRWHDRLSSAEGLMLVLQNKLEKINFLWPILGVIA